MTTHSTLPAHQRKLAAEALIDEVLTDVERGLWPYDEWARHGLAHSIANLNRGLYSLAMVEAVKVETPLFERSKGPIANTPNVTLPQLRRAFRYVQSTPPRDYPIFC